MKKIYLLPLMGLGILLLAILFIYSTDKEKISDKDYEQAFRNNYKIFSPSIPSAIDFAGEATPLNLIYVRENLDRELLVNTYWHTSTILLLKRAHRWFPVIEPILKKYNIPDDFKYLSMVESGLTNAVSPKGASGYWQFLDKTAKQYGLEVNDDVDERYNVEKSTVAACSHLLALYDSFKDWTLVAAAYNAGEKRISDAIAKQQIDNYYDLYIGEETSRYVFRILALKYIYEHPVQYGFYIREADLYPVIPTKKIEVKESIDDLVAFSLKHNINYSILKEFNPWLRSDHLPDLSGKLYTILIPKDGFPEYKKLDKKINEPDKIFNDTLKVDEIN